MDKNTIAFVVPTVEFGGAELQVINQINFFVKEEIKVILIVLNNIKAMQETIDLPAERIFELNYAVHSSYSKAILKAYTLPGRILSILKENKVEVVLANLPFTHYVMRLVKLKSFTTNTRFKLINYHHSIQYIESPLDTLFKTAFNSYNSVLARLTDDKNIFISESSCQNVKENFYVKSPTVVYNSVPYKIVESNLAIKYLEYKNKKVGEYTLVLPGRLNKAKGHSFFIDVFKEFVHLNDIRPHQVQLVFAGGGALEAEINSLLSAKGLEEYIHITGFISNDLLLSFLSLSNLVVIPSVFEGFGNVALEALMVRKLILASDAGGLKEIIHNGENGFLFKALDGEECLKHLNSLYHKRNSIIIPEERLALDFSTRFSFDAHIQKLLAEIKSIS